MAEKKRQDGGMAENDAAIVKAMEKARERFPALGSPAWAKQQAEKKGR